MSHKVTVEVTVNMRDGFDELIEARSRIQKLIQTVDPKAAERASGYQPYGGSSSQKADPVWAMALQGVEDQIHAAISGHIDALSKREEAEDRMETVLAMTYASSPAGKALVKQICAVVDPTGEMLARIEEVVDQPAAASA